MKEDIKMSKKKNRRPYQMDDSTGYDPELDLNASTNTEDITSMEGVAGEVKTTGDTIHIHGSMSTEEVNAITSELIDVVSNPNTEISLNDGEEVVNTPVETEEAVINKSIVTLKEESPKEEVKPVETKEEAEERREVKTVVKKPFEGEKTTGRWRLCIVKGASELRWIQIKKKIKTLGINCEFNEKEKSIYSAVFGRKSDAIAVRKELQRKGLSPSIEEVR